jgi:TonB family protein
LFVRDGEAEDRVDLTKQDVDAGAYTWQPKGNDVTFRLEAIDAAGRISAESFRVIRQSSGAATSAAAVPAASGPASSLPARAPAANEPAAHLIPAKATHKVPPVVPASIRPRISGVIPVDVRVRINAHGRVTSATPTIKPRPGLSAYLTSRAVYAARLWRFTPARENGRPTASTQTIHFVFEK